MADINVMKLDEATQGDNFAATQLPPPERPISTKRTPQDVFALAIVFAAGGVLLMALIAVLRLVFCWDASYAPSAECRAIVGVQWLFIGGIVVGIVAYIGVALWSMQRRTAVETLRAAVVRDEFGIPTTAQHIAATPLDVYGVARQLQAATRVEVARAQPYGAGIDALNFGSTQAKQVAEPAQQIIAAETLTPVALDTWLGWANEAPHLLIAGSTGAGKSTLADVLLARRADRGDTIAILDPHWSPLDKHGRAKWGGIAPLATTMQAIYEQLAALNAEYGVRLAQLQAGKVAEGCFPPLTVLVDEVPEVYTAMKDHWKGAVTTLGSGARKVNLSVVLLSQSPLVEDIGLNSAMRKNYTRIALNDEAPALLKAEPDSARKRELLDLLRGQQYPAAMIYRSEAHVLTREGLPGLRRARIAAEAWCPSASERVSNERLEPKTDGRTAKINLLRGLRRQGLSREQARAWCEARRITFENALWTEAA
jgi:hypothetical protein